MLQYYTLMMMKNNMKDSKGRIWGMAGGWGGILYTGVGEEFGLA
jgi:hypothetical protein